MSRPPNQTEEGLPIYTFVHIPKCGGTSVEVFFETHYGARIFGTTHKWLAEKENNPIVIIRDPVERFISLFHYWKNGSHGRNSRGTEFSDKYGNFTIKDFIGLVKNNSRNELVSSYMWRIHYSPQTEWIKPDVYENSIVITYVPNLNEKIKQLLEYINVPNIGIELDRRNITRVKQGEEDVRMDEEDILWLREHFKEDFELWETAFKSPEKFKKVL